MNFKTPIISWVPQKFRSKHQWNATVQMEIFRKKWSTFRGGLWNTRNGRWEAKREKMRMEGKPSNQNTSRHFNSINQSDRQANSCRRHKGREKSCIFNDWLSKWCETYKPIKKSSNANQMLRADHLTFEGGGGVMGDLVWVRIPPPPRLKSQMVGPWTGFNKEKINQPTHQSHLRLTINRTWETRKHKTSHIPSDRNQQLLLLLNTYLFILCLKVCMLIHNGHQSMWIVTEVCNFLFRIYF